MDDSDEDVTQHEELVGLQIERLDEELPLAEKVSNRREKNKRRAGNKIKKSIIDPPDSTYSLSFSKFVEYQQAASTQEYSDQEIQAISSEGTSGMAAQTRQKSCSLQVTTAGSDVSDDDGENEPHNQILSGPEKKRKHEELSTDENGDLMIDKTSTAKDKFRDMNDRDLLVETVKTVKAVYRKQFRQEVLEREILSRLERVEDTCRVYNSDENITWPFTKRETLDNIEQKLEKKDDSVKRSLIKQFQQADRKTLYAFLHSNLMGLLAHVGRWTWTGRKSNSVKGDGPISEAAQDLRSVTLLKEVALTMFPTLNIQDEVLKVLTNINNQKKTQSKSKQ